MNNSTRVAAFTAGLVATFGIAYGLGTLIDAPAASAGHGDHAAAAPEDAAPETVVGATDLQVHTPIAAADPNAPIAFRIVAADGRPVTDFDTEHEKRLHLIAVTDDLVDFQHVHPTLAADGTWTTTMNLSRPGGYRLIADYVPTGGTATVATASIAVPGAYAPRPLPPPSTTARVDGYTVTLHGTVTAGAASEVTLNVSRDGRPVTDLQPYLGAYGHLVALRATDGDYLHVHPEGAPGDGRTAPGPDVRFTVHAPTAGDYRLFLDFRHDGEVRTAAFTVTVAGGAPAAPATASAPSTSNPEGAHDGH